MTDFQINDHILQKECETLADEFLEEFADDIKAGELDTVRDGAIEWAHQTADSHQWVIYNYKALQLCANCDTSYGETFADDCFHWKPNESTIYSVATAIAYGEINGRINAEIAEKLDEIENA